ncbi:MAG: DNA repair protein RecO [Methylocystaceae bacterium]
MTSYYQCEALIIKSISYKESDELVTFFAPDTGKTRALARGIKKVRSSLRAPLQPFCQSKLHLVQGRELDTISQAAIIDFFPVLRDEFTLSLVGMYLMELLDKGLGEHEPAPDVYRLTLAVLHGIASGLEPNLLLRFFELNFLARLGYRPELKHCARCQQTSNLVFFSPIAGGAICSICKQTEPQLGSLPISGEVLGIMRLLLSGEMQACHRLKASPMAQLALEKIIESYWQYHLEQPLQMKALYQKFTLPPSK